MTDWIRSSFSSSNCVEAARLDTGTVGVRHSKTPDAGTLVFTPEEWQAFLAGVCNGEFDHLT